MPLPEAFLLTFRHRSIAAAALSLSLLAAGALVGCRPADPLPPRAAPPQAPAEARRQQQLQRQRQQLAARQCRQRREELLQGLAELRRAEAALADQRARAATPTELPPVWDEEKESRYSEVDQELDRQRYEQELAAWRARHAGSFQQRERLAAAQQRLNRQAQLLQQRYPGLFTGPESIEVRPQELARLSRCPQPPD